jgi:hypothetical protein
VACNTGIGLSPLIDGKPHRFRVGGLYNGLALIEDVETRSYWDHTTGECIHGPLRGTQLAGGVPLQYLTAEATRDRYPQAQLAISRPGVRQRVMHRMVIRRMLSPEGHLPSVFSPSLLADDERRPRMELGLGVWWPGVSRFYPLDVLRQHGGAVFDSLGERRVLVFLDQGSAAPVAARTDATHVRRDGQDLVLDTGEIVRGHERIDAKGVPHRLELVPQMFTRWYGFSSTFPGCDVYTP